MMYSVVTKNVNNAANNEQNIGDCNTEKIQQKNETEIDNIQADNARVTVNNKRRDSTQVWTPLLENGGKKLAENKANFEIVLNSNDSKGVTYAGEVSNNNEWNDDNLKTKNIDNSLNCSNNNGSATNGKTGTGLIDKSDEHDPLTGLYKEKPDNNVYNESEKGLEQEGCGLFGCKPKWARSLASTHMFMVVFLLAYILQGMYMTYFVSVITTIEKLFQIKSKTTGFLLSASEMGQISTAMLLTYYAGRGHRPRWIACGMVLFSIAAFACALPHFIFGKELIHSTAFLIKNGANNMTDNGKSSLSFHIDDLTHNGTSIMTHRHVEMNLCQVDDNPQNTTTGER